MLGNPFLAVAQAHIATHTHARARGTHARGTHVRMHVRTHARTHTRTHTHTHTHTHTQTHEMELSTKCIPTVTQSSTTAKQNNTRTLTLTECSCHTADGYENLKQSNVETNTCVLEVFTMLFTVNIMLNGSQPDFD